MVTRLIQSFTILFELKWVLNKCVACWNDDENIDGMCIREWRYYLAQFYNVSFYSIGDIKIKQMVFLTYVSKLNSTDSRKITRNLTKCSLTYSLVLY